MNILCIQDFIAFVSSTDAIHALSTCKQFYDLVKNNKYFWYNYTLDRYKFDFITFIDKNIIDPYHVTWLERDIGGSDRQHKYRLQLRELRMNSIYYWVWRGFYVSNVYHVKEAMEMILHMIYPDTKCLNGIYSDLMYYTRHFDNKLLFSSDKKYAKFIDSIMLFIKHNGTEWYKKDNILKDCTTEK